MREWAKIHRSVNYSATLAGLSDFAERLFWRIVSQADSWGRMPAEPEKVRAMCAGMLTDRSSGDVADALDEIEAAGRIVRYDGTLAVVDWDGYQETKGRGKPKFPEPPDNSAPLRTTSQRSEAVGTAPEKSEKVSLEERRGEEKRTPPQTPPRDEVWDTLVDLFGEPSNDNERGKRNKAVKLLRQSLNGVANGGTEIRRRAHRWPKLYPAANLTDTALANNWTSLASPRTRPAANERPVEEPEPAPAEVAQEHLQRWKGAA